MPGGLPDVKDAFLVTVDTNNIKQRTVIVRAYSLEEANEIIEEKGGASVVFEPISFTLKKIPLSEIPLIMEDITKTKRPAEKSAE